MTGYIRNDTSNNIADANVVNAADLDGEFDALVATFNASTGHSHDGTAAEGSPITVTGPAQEFLFDGTAIYPKTDGLYDLGKSAAEFKDLFIDGVANVDSLVADTADINGGTIDATVIGAGTPAAGSFTTLDTNGLTIVKAAGSDLTTFRVQARASDAITDFSFRTNNGAAGERWDIRANVVSNGTMDFRKDPQGLVALIEPTTVSANNDKTIITREKGDARYINKAGDTVTGNTTYNDNIKAIFGTGGDLEIFHDGSNSIIRDVGTGNLVIRGTNLGAYNFDGSKVYWFAADGGFLSLYYDNSVKAQTVDSGVRVTGQLSFPEQASATALGAGFGSIWVKNTAPSSPFFTSDTGVDTKLAGTAINETITGTWTFSNNVTLSSTASAGTHALNRNAADARYAQLGAVNTFTGIQTISSTAPSIWFYETDQPLNEKTWAIRGAEGDLALDLRNDDGTSLTFGHYIFERDGNLNVARSVVTREEGDLRYVTQTGLGTELAGLAFGAVGTYAMCFRRTTGALAAGASVAGSALVFAGVRVTADPVTNGVIGGTTTGALAGDTTPSGTWRFMGNGAGEAAGYPGGIFLRIS